MVGKVIFRLADRRHAAELSDDLRWRCDEPQIQRLLDENFPAYLVADEDPETIGRHMLYRAAYRLSGEVRLDRGRPVAV